MKKIKKNLFLKFLSFLLLILGWIFINGQNNNLFAQAFSLANNNTPPLIFSQQSPISKKVADPFSPHQDQIIILSSDVPKIPNVHKKVQSAIKKHRPKIKIISIKKSSTIVTAYSSTVDQTDSTPFINASGKRVRFGTVACNFLPLGTKIKFDNFYPQLVFVVEDRMNKRFNNRIDIWFPSRAQATAFGKRKMNYQIVKITK